MSVEQGVHDLFEFYLQNLAFEIGELERRCRFSRNVEENIERSPECLRDLFCETASADAGELKATEAVLYRYPEVHNEIRMALSHIGRAVAGVKGIDDKSFRKQLGSAGGEDWDSLERIVASCCEGEDAAPYRSPRSAKQRRKEAKRQLGGARKHLLRALMDARKGQYEVTERAVSLAFDYCLKFGIHGLDSGNLVRSVRKAMNKGQAAYKNGKLSEALGYHNVAASFYDEALERIDKAGRKMGSKAPDFRVRQKKYRKNRRKHLVRVVVRGLFGWVIPAAN